jgi:uncharacterized protein YndB with AHSA1/START domain
MTNTAPSTFVYVTYIRSTQEKVWNALTDKQFIKQYWFGVTADSDWKVGSSWKLTLPDGRTADSGEILESEAPKRLVIKWRNEFMPELNAEGYGKCVFELEPVNGAVKLTITHSNDTPASKTITAVSGGWPRILSNLKSLLETGELTFKEKPAR